MGFNIVDGSSNGDKFLSFLKTDILPKIKNKTILMDNVSFHHKKEVIDTISNSGNNILYNVAYNPDTNPVENCFSVSKNFVKKREPSIIKSLNLLTSNKLFNMFKNSFSE